MAWVKIFAIADHAKNRIGDKKIQLVRLNGKLIFITRIGDHFYGADNECPHEGASLANGHIGFRQEIVCPWHGYRFSLSNGREITGKRCPKLKIYEVKSDSNGLFIKTK